MLQSGRVPAESQGQFNFILGNLAYNQKDYARAETALSEALRLGFPEIDAYALLVESKERQGKSAEALTVLEQAVAKAKEQGKTLPEAYYGRGIAIGYKSKLPGPTERLRRHGSPAIRARTTGATRSSPSAISTGSTPITSLI